MLKWFPIWVPWIMDFSTGSVGVTVIITADFDFFEFLLQELDVTFEEFLEIGFHAQGKVRQIWRHNILCHCLFYPSFLNFVRGMDIGRYCLKLILLLKMKNLVVSEERVCCGKCEWI